MTIVSSGALALQDLGTNTSSTVDNVRLNTSFTAGVDGLLQIKRQQEVDDGVFVDVNVWQGDAYGFNSNMFSTFYIHNVFDLDVGPTFGNVKYASVSNIGSLGTSGYLSADGTSRTIGGVFWGLPDASANNVRLFIFALNGTGVTNTDTAAWSKIEVTTNGGTTVTINRSDLSYDSSENGDSWWYFSGSSGTVYNAIGSLGTPSSSSYTIKVIGGTTTATLNNGIAEEFGGDDSANVKMSDYYKGAASGFVTSNVTASIPTTGQIKFSGVDLCLTVAGVNSAALPGSSILLRKCGEVLPFFETLKLQRFIHQRDGSLSVLGSKLCLSVGGSSAATYSAFHRWRTLFVVACATADPSLSQWEFVAPED